MIAGSKRFLLLIPIAAAIGGIALVNRDPAGGSTPSRSFSEMRSETAGAGVSPAGREVEASVQDAGVSRQVEDVRFEFGRRGVDVSVAAGALSVAPREMRIGGTVLFDRDAEAPARTAADGAVTYRRAPHVEERYLPRPRGMEQIWVLDRDLERLRNDGDLRITVSLETELAARLALFHGDRPTVRFFNGLDEALLEYGAAVAIDADGNRHDLSYRLGSAELEMTLDAAFLAQARFPLTIDPLVGAPIPIDASAMNTSTRPLDVAYNSSRNEWLVVWCENNDVLGKVVSAAGVPGAQINIAPGTGVTQAEPAVAYSLASNRYLVVFWQRTGGGATQLIWGVLLDTNGAVIGGRFRITDAGGGAGHRRRPDVAFSVNNWLVAWEQDGAGSNRDIFARRVPVAHIPGAALPAVPFPVATLSPTPELSPALADIGGDNWLAVWDQNGTIRGRPVSAAGTLGTLRTYSTGTNRWPDVAANPGNGALVVWENQPAPGPNWNIQAAALDSAGAPVSPVVALSASGSNDSFPKAAYGASSGQYLIGWHQAADVRAIRLWANGAAVAGTEGNVDGFQVVPATAPDEFPALAMNATTNEMLIAYRGGGGPAFTINAQRFGMPYTGPATPTFPAQNRATPPNAPVPVGGWTNDQINLSALSSDPDLGQTFRLQFEVRPVGTPMTSPGTLVPDNVVFFESLPSVDNDPETLVKTVTGLVNGTLYHWQVRAIDSMGLASLWAPFPQPPNAGNPPAITAATDFAVDTVPPTISILPPSTTLTRAGPVTYTITYGGASLVSLDASDVHLVSPMTATGVVSVNVINLTTATVTIDLITGDGPLGITIDAGTAEDLAGNLAPAAGPSMPPVTVDNTPPTIAITGPDDPITNTGPVNYLVTYGGADVISLDPTDVTLNATGPATGTVSVEVVDAVTRRVRVSPTSGNGFLSISIAANTANDLAGNMAPSAGPSASFEVDNTPPTIAISAPDDSITNTGPVHFTVTYSGASVVTLDPGDITLNRTLTANGTVGVTIVDSTQAIVEISGITGDGTIGISIGAGTANDPAGNVAPAAGPSLTFTVDNTPPAIVVSGPSTSLTNIGPVTYTVDYVGASSVTLNTGDLSLTPTGSAVGTLALSGGPTSFTVTVSPTSGNGTLALQIASGTALDAAGNPAAAASGAAFTVDNIPPTISISAPTAATTVDGPVSYTVTYGGATNITLSSVTLNTTGTATGTVAISINNPTSATVTILNISGDGTIGISIAAGTATDGINLAPAAGPSATFVVDDPNTFILPPTSLQASGLTNPTNLMDTPTFSAIHNWQGTGPLPASGFQIQVSTSPTLSLNRWNSPTQVAFPGGNVAAGFRSSEIPYGLGGDQSPFVPLLNWNSQYYWRTRFYDTMSAESDFSTENASFRMGIPWAVASANGNGSPTTPSLRIMCFPIAVGTSVSYNEMRDDGGPIYRLIEETRTWQALASTDLIEGGRGYFVQCGHTSIFETTTGTVALGAQAFDLTYTTHAVPVGAEAQEGRPANYYRGGHAIGNPFNRWINWDDPAQGGDVDKPNAKPTYYKWDGAQYQTYNCETGEGTAGKMIPPFLGFGINVMSVNSGNDLIIRDALHGSALAPLKVSRREKASVSATPDAWALQLVARSGEAVDTENFVGVDVSSNDGWDRRDAEEPGTLADQWVLLSFPQEGSTTPYTHDFRQTPLKAGEEVSWSMTVSSNTNGMVTLTWPNIGRMPASDWSFSIEDPEAGTSVDLSRAASMEIGPLNGSRTLVLKAGRTKASAPVDPDPAPAPGDTGSTSRVARRGGGDRCGLLGVEFLLLGLGLWAVRRRKGLLA